MQLAGVQAHPHLDLAGRERLLTLRSGSQRFDWIGEGIQERIPLCVDLDAAVSGEGGAQQPAMLRERIDVGGFAELLEEPRRPLDIGQQHRDDSERTWIRHTATVDPPAEDVNKTARRTL